MRWREKDREREREREREYRERERKKKERATERVRDNEGGGVGEIEREREREREIGEREDLKSSLLGQSGTSRTVLRDCFSEFFLPEKQSLRTVRDVPDCPKGLLFRIFLCLKKKTVS